jgi:hypothetical protein
LVGILELNLIIIKFESVVFLLTEIYQPKIIGLTSAINLLLSKDKSDQEKTDGLPIQVFLSGWVCFKTLSPYK